MKTIRFLVPVVMAFMLAACGNSFTMYSYEDAELYKVGDASFSQPIKEINVAWYGGDVDFVLSDNPDLRIREESDITLPDSLRMRYYVDNDSCLKIVFCHSGTKRVEDYKQLHKHLTVEVPRGTLLDEVSVNTVHGQVNIDSVHSNEFELYGVSTRLNAVYPVLPDEIVIEGVRCKAALYVPADAGLTVSMDGLSTDFKSELPMTKKDGNHVIGNGACEVDMEAVSGTLNIKVI